MTKERAEKMREARWLYGTGWKLVRIAAKIGVPVGTIRRWKCLQHWDEQRGNTSEKSASSPNNPLLESISDTLENSTLTNKQRQFAIHYAKSFNATRSYLKVYGCSYPSALVRGPVLAGKAEIKNVVRRVRKALYAETLLSPDDIFQKSLKSLLQISRIL